MIHILSFRFQVEGLYLSYPTVICLNLLASDFRLHVFG